MTTATRGRVKVEESAKRVRIYLGGELIADTRRPRLVWEGPYYPAYYLPRSDVRMDRLFPTGRVKHSPSRGDAALFTVHGGTGERARVAENAAWQYADSPLEELWGLIRFRWEAMDAWFEEDEEVFTHPRDPYSRVDILRSSRHVRVVLDGITIAESDQPTILFETGLPPRYYLPQTHVRMDLLVPTDSQTHCPYKGSARYWSVRAGDRLYADYAWSYRAPFAESQKIAGLVAFYNEKVDLYVDGELLVRPRTHFS